MITLINSRQIVYFQHIKVFSFDWKLMIMIKAFHNSTTYDVGKPRYWKHKWLKRNVSFLNNSWCWPHFLCQYDISFESLFRLWMNQSFHFQIRSNLVYTTICRTIYWIGYESKWFFLFNLCWTKPISIEKIGNENCRSVFLKLKEFRKWQNW